MEHFYLFILLNGLKQVFKANFISFWMYFIIVLFLEKSVYNFQVSMHQKNADKFLGVIC